MGSYLGVDWAGGCWLVVKTGASTLVTTEPTILNVWHEHGADAASMLVDVPIGLPAAGTRACDAEASELLAARGSTVFSIPRREVVETDDYERARELNGGSLGSQSWWLFPRIREVDVFLQAHDEARATVYESHPEVCFATLAGRSLPPKDTAAGRRERLATLADESPLHSRVGAVVREREDGTEWHDRISAARLDDVLDAAVLAYTAKRLALGARDETDPYPALPTATEERDEVLGVPMEIVYPGARRG